MTLVPTAYIDDLVNANGSLAQTLGVFAKVNGHEPKNAPGKDLAVSFWLDRIRPARTTSGLNTTSLLIVMNGRISTDSLSDPQNEIDPRLGRAAGILFAAYHADLTLGGKVQSVDVFGREGVMLEGAFRYFEQDRRHFRAHIFTVPMIVNDVFDQAP